MMHQATEKICEALDAAEMHYRVREVKDSSIVVAGIATKLTNFEVLFISDDDDNDVAVRIYRFVSFDESRTEDMIRVVNKLNDEYRFYKFTVDLDDATITVSYDFPLSCEEVGETAVEVILKLLKACDKFYAEIMKALWAD